MAEFIETEEKVIDIDEPVIFENKTDSDFEVSAGIVFRKSGLYEVSIVGRRTIISKVAESQSSDAISRQAAIAVADYTDYPGLAIEDAKKVTDEVVKRLKQLPSAQLERDIPIKPIETTDRAWGIPHRQAVCPKCNYYLGHVAFLGDYKGKRITYCETCGQAIDWEGWDFDE